MPATKVGTGYDRQAYLLVSEPSQNFSLKIRKNEKQVIV